MLLDGWTHCHFVCVWGGAVGFGTDSNAAMLLASVAGRPTAETEAITTEKVFHN